MDVRPVGRKSAKQNESNRQIKEPPQHIDECRGFSYARRGREWALEPAAAHPLNEMRDPVGQKQSGKNCIR